MQNPALACFAVLVSLCAVTATPARAEVTLYGILDTYVGYTNAGGKGAQTAMQSGGLSASRVGIRGSEDLGGGRRATFDLRNGIRRKSGEASAYTPAFIRD